jgi:hypothetical protein
MTAWRFAFLLILAASPAAAQPPGTNYDEAKVPQYTLPDPLVMANGQPVRDVRTWNTKRRPEILELFRSNVYGRSPARPKGIRYELAEISREAFGGTAVRKQVTAYFSPKQDGPKMEILIYLPAAARKPVPVFLSLGFTPNQGVHADPAIRMGDIWLRNPRDKDNAKERATEKSRGSVVSRWGVERILARGYGLAVVYYCDIEPDFDGGMRYGIRPLYDRPGQPRPPDAWAAIGAWAWGLSRVLDYLETDKDVDARRVAVMGHSRLGKTALWAGAEDTRFAMVISNDSGEGGASLARRRFGERVKNLNTAFPHWFCDNYRKYNDREDDLPVDQHMLIALIAPRPVYVASAQEDLWADPKGEFLSAAAAGPVYRLLGKQGLDTDQMPAVHQPIMNTVGYHIRAGKHDITAYDWDRYMDFADKHFGGKR